MLAVLVRNLADNAIRYAPAAAAIRVAVRREGDHVVLVVENGGAAPSREEMARLGERFFRALGTGESGSGLGLSIVRRIAQLHRAEVGFSVSSQLGGLRVTVSFAAP
jgi:two-component system, OmpR family, sensor histidine kinase QseC